MGVSPGTTAVTLASPLRAADRRAGSPWVKAETSAPSGARGSGARRRMTASSARPGSAQPSPGAWPFRLQHAGALPRSSNRQPGSEQELGCALLNFDELLGEPTSSELIFASGWANPVRSIARELGLVKPSAILVAQPAARCSFAGPLVAGRSASSAGWVISYEEPLSQIAMKLRPEQR